MKAKLVFIEWEDSYGCSSNWQEINPEGEPEIMLCHSVGWIIRKTRKCVVVVPHLSQNTEIAKQQGCGDMTIPTACIVRMIPLHIPKRVSASSCASLARDRNRRRS